MLFKKSMIIGGPWTGERMGIEKITAEMCLSMPCCINSNVSQLWFSVSPYFSHFTFLSFTAYPHLVGLYLSALLFHLLSFTAYPRLVGLCLLISLPCYFIFCHSQHTHILLVYSFLLVCLAISSFVIHSIPTSCWSIPSY
jgi:hypothetical protein